MIDADPAISEMSMAMTTAVNKRLDQFEVSSSSISVIKSEESSKFISDEGVPDHDRLSRSLSVNSFLKSP